jgi:hypothetical protein
MRWILLLMVLAGRSWAGGEPPAFTYAGGRAVPIDIETVDIEYHFDVAKATATCRAVVAFKVLESGFPILDLVPNAEALELDGTPLPPATLKLAPDPDSVTHLRILQHAVTDQAQHTLVIRYKLAENDVTFGSGTVRTAFHMSDLPAGGRTYFEQFGPANLEYDQVHYRFRVRVTGTSAEHELFANGALTANGAGDWTVDFPTFFTTSSIFFHLTNKGRYHVSRTEYDGIDHRFPVTVYSSSEGTTQRALAVVKKVLEENEKTYGPFAHARLVIYVTDGGGGMEYCGAAASSFGALGHELTHSWFARGVMPAQGNAGWIDEAVASWRDNGYPRASSGPSGSATNLGGFPAYRRHTPREAYTRGARLLSQLDFQFKDNGGLRGLLRQLFAEKKRIPITVDFFQTFLQNSTGQNLAAVFQKYVYGQVVVNGVPMVVAERFPTLAGTGHPLPFTPAERARFR